MNRLNHRILRWIAALVFVGITFPLSACNSSSNTPPPNLMSIAVTPPGPSIVNGNSQQFTGTGSYSDGSMKDITTSATWASSNKAVATIGANTGLAASVGPGASQITAMLSGVTSLPDTLTVTSSSSGAPALVQHVSSSNNRGNSLSGPSFCYHTSLPNAATAGNAVVVGFTFNSSLSPTVKDDKGENYAVEANFFDSAHTQSIAIAAFFNVVAGARAISVCFPSNPGGFIQPMATEFANVTGFDVASAGGMGNNATVLTAGNLTPTATGDLIYQVGYGLATNQDQTSVTVGSQSNITWNLLSADLMDGLAGQFGAYNSITALNPTMSMGTPKNWISIAVALKTGTAGSVPSGMRIVRLLHENIPTKTAAGGNGTSFPSPTKLQAPCSGNLGVVSVGGGNQNLTSITDSNLNTWQAAIMAYVTTSDPSTDVFYAANASCSGTETLTVHWNGNTTDQTILFYDVAGAAVSPFDVAVGATGNAASDANTLTAFSITPSTSSTELIFCAMPVQFNTIDGLTTGLNDANLFDGESQSGPEPVDENNGWGHFVTNSTNTVSVIWHIQQFSPNLQIWASVGAAFKSGP